MTACIGQCGGDGRTCQDVKRRTLLKSVHDEEGQGKTYVVWFGVSTATKGPGPQQKQRCGNDQPANQHHHSHVIAAVGRTRLRH